MKRFLSVMLFFAATLLISVPAVAQQRGNPPSQDRPFDPSTMETVSGIITRIDSVQSARGPSMGMHVQLQAARDTLAVHLGPAWFLANRSMALAVGDSLTVRGSRVTLQDTPALIAAEVHHGSQMLRLRNEAGRPLWRRQHPRR